MLFSGGKFTDVSVGRVHRHRDFFSQHKTPGELKFFAGDRCCFLGRTVTKSL